MNKQKLIKGLTAIVPIAALFMDFVADYLSEKEKDQKYVSREEFEKLLKDKKES